MSTAAQHVQNAQQLIHIHRMMEEGRPLATALLLAGVSRSKYYRMKEEPKAQPIARKGRPAQFTLTEQDRRVLHWFAAHTESASAALESFSRFDTPRANVPHQPGSGAARQAVRDHMEKARRAGKPWEPTVTMRRAAGITKAERNEIRGGRATLATSLTRPRDQTMLIFDKAGGIIRANLWPGCGFVSDDMSINTPFSYVGADGVPTVGRQSLMTRDINSLQWLGSDLIGRPRQSYQVEDIADHFLSVVDDWGLPYFWRMEMGPWCNDFLNGIRLPPEYGRPEGERWGGLKDLIRIVHKFSPRGKGEIEGGFRRIQEFMRHLSTDVGRTRGEFQTASRLYGKALRGCPKAQDYFWGMSAAADGLRDVACHDNGRAKYRASLGGRMLVPEEMWAERRTVPLPAGERWRFLPVKRALTLRNHAVRASVKHWPMGFQFQVNDMPGVRLMENGYRLLVAFHPGRPDEGAAIFNGESGRSVRNIEGRAFGEYMGCAPWVPAAPQEDFTGTGDYGAQTRANAAVRREYRQAVPPGTGPGTMKSTARDGLGRALHLSQGSGDGGAEAPPPETTPASRPRAVRASALVDLYGSAASAG
ncbi:MAG: hypothetical protein V4726_11145 [Verrucomicrobiota bacterium]